MVLPVGVSWGVVGVGKSMAEDNPYHPSKLYIYQHEWLMFKVNNTSPMDPVGNICMVDD